MNSFHAPFLFDDGPAIVANPAIRDLGNIGAVLWPSAQGGETTSGRPLVTVSLALNYALSGEDVGSYHVLNFLIHGGAALALLGIVRRTFQTPQLHARFGAIAVPLATAVAALWLLHPLQTSAVTYIVQRAESLMALLYLLTLYFFVRSAQSAQPARWLAASFGCCLLGMATKEVMVSAPLIVLLYDRAFIAGTWREAWRARRGYYLALAATWILLAALVWRTEGRGGTAGFETAVAPLDYLLTQCSAIARYLRLALWPHPLVFDYGTDVVDGLADVFLPALLLTLSLVATGWAVWRRPMIGFLGCWFFAILAPSSSVVPVASQTMAEHRMYLPLAAVIVAPVLALQTWLGRRSWIVVAMIGLTFGVLTLRRNHDYRSELSIWADTAAKLPTNARAHNNLGLAELRRENPTGALSHFEKARRLHPEAAEPHYNHGVCLAQLGRHADAARSYEAALAVQPDHAEAHNNLGNAWWTLGRWEDARAHYEQAVRLKPAFASAHSNLGNVLVQLGDAAGALRHCEAALRLQPNDPNAHYNAGNACAALGRLPAARRHYEATLALKPNDASAHNNLGNVLLELDDPNGALSHYQRAIAAEPDYLDPRRSLALLLAQLGRWQEALPHLEILSRARPDDDLVNAALARARTSRP